MLKDYPMHNCENCGFAYMEYFKDDSRCTKIYVHDVGIDTKGLCSDCNPYSYSNKKCLTEKQMSELKLVLDKKDIEYKKYRGYNFAAI